MVFLFYFIQIIFQLNVYLKYKNNMRKKNYLLKKNLRKKKTYSDFENAFVGI